MALPPGTARQLQDRGLFPLAVEQELSVRRLNLGDGGIDIQGFEGRDGRRGDVLFPLPDADASCDEIRASHVLEHFRHAQVPAVLAEWVRVLKPGGILKIAVPDFEAIARAYLAGERIPVEGYVMGGQVDARDHHQALFDRESLTAALRAAGLINIRDWASEAQDCAALPISLNLAGTKRGGPLPRVTAVLTVPRLGFNDFWGSAFNVFAPTGIPLRKFQGAYWEKGLTRVLSEAIEQDAPDYILTLDYDSVFAPEHVEALLDLAARHPEADAIAPLQTARHHALPMFTLRGADGAPLRQLDRAVLEREELLPAATAHFGLTLIKTAALQAVPRPWFWGNPGEAGAWEDGDSVDADVLFWQRFADAGRRLFVTPRVAIGHLELMIRWPDSNLECLYQAPREWQATGTPDGAWR